MDQTLIDALSPVIAQASLVILTTMLGLVLASLRGFLQTKLSKEHFTLLTEVANKAVMAAESGELGGFVADKKGYAEETVLATFDKAGLKVTKEQLEAAIEAAVLENFNYGKTADDEVILPGDGSDVDEAGNDGEGGLPADHIDSSDVNVPDEGFIAG